MKKHIFATTALTLLLASTLVSAHTFGVSKNGPIINPYAQSNLSVQGHPLQLQEDLSTRHTNPKEVNPLFRYVGYDNTQTVPSSTQTPARSHL